MSLSFKTVNINSSTKTLLTKEQIDFVFKPVQIILVQPEEIVTASDTGPIIESTSPTGSNLDSNVGVLVLDNVPYIKETDEINVVFTGDGGGRTGRGTITIGQLTAAVVRDFENRTYGAGTTTTGPGGETVGTASPRGRLIIDRINPDGSTERGGFGDGSSGPSGRA